jgi:hypothetical protein
MRQEITDQKGNRFVYGDDHMEGLFFEVWSYDGALLQFDSRMHNGMLTIKGIVAIAEEWGFDISHELPDETIDYDD